MNASPGTHRYQVADLGLRVALFFTRTPARPLHPGLAQALGPGPPQPLGGFDRLEAVLEVVMDHACQAYLAA